MVIFLVGTAVDAGAKNLVRGAPDTILQRIPLIGSVYGTSKQLVGIVDKEGGDPNLKGMRAVFCQFGGASGAGVLALLVSSERFSIHGREYHAVIVPTAPVPVGGGLLFVPVDRVQPVDVSVEGLMSIYVSMGVTAPQFLPARLKPRRDGRSRSVVPQWSRGRHVPSWGNTPGRHRIDPES